MQQRIAKRILYTLCLVLTLLISQPLAQTPVDFNETVLGELTTSPITYTFVGVANQQISLEILSVTDGFAPSYLLLDANNNVISQGQPAAGELNIRQDLTLPFNGAYSLIVTSANAQLGEYVLRLMSATTVPQPTSSSSSTGLSADQCEAITTQLMLLAVEQTCNAVERNEMCYVNNSLQTIPTLPNFAVPGDIGSLTDVASVSMSPFANNGADWGVALLQVQANLPDTLPGQNVTILAFGGVSLEANPVANATAPMQSFYFTGGIGESECRDTPTDGIYIESPADAGVVELVINDVNLQIASSVFIGVNNSDPANVELEFNTLEGLVIVERNGVQQLAPTGQKVGIQINEAFEPISNPRTPEQIDTNLIPAAVREVAEVESQTTPSAPLQPSATPTEEGIVQPVLPTAGQCVMATFEPVVVNARRGPGESFEPIGRLDPERTYNVIGRDSASTWYETSQGWSAGFVTRRGGDCSNVPITYFPPTATPAPTATSSSPIAGANNYNVTVDALIFETQHNLSGQLSYPNGVSADRINIDVINEANSSGALYMSINCTGFGVEAASILFDSGEAYPCQGGYNYIDAGLFNSAYGIRIILEDYAPDGAFVTWTMSLRIGNY